MKANYKVTGNDRKALVAAIENLTGDKAVYMRMPTCAYEIGDITVDKEGGLTCDDADKLERLIHNLIADGFTPEDTEEDESDDKAIGLTISLPLDKVAVGNLTNLLTAKERLIKKALGIDDLDIEVSEDTISFPWFTEMPDPETVKAYTHFILTLSLTNPKAILFYVSFFVQFIDVNAKAPGVAFFILALTLEVISFCYMSFLILSGSFVTRYVKTRKKLAKLGNSLIGLVFVGFAARLATLQS